MGSGDENRQHDDVPARDVLLRTSNEVRMLSEMAADLQDLVGNLVVAGAFGGSQSIYQLQSLDRLSQNLEAVAEFLRTLSESAPLDWKVDIARVAETVKLTDVSERLSGQQAGAEDSSGEFEDFDNWPLTG